MRRLALAAAAALALTGGCLAGGPGSAPEPAGLHMGAMPGYTPATLAGAEVVDAAAVAALVAMKKVTLVDVAQPDRKPTTLAADAVWRPQHRTIPGAVWFPDSGWGDLAPERVETLKARITSASGGDLDRPVVVFCRPDCWGSWNVGKRLVGWGFRNVRWFPGGINGWLEADLPTAVVKPDAEWTASAAAVR